MTPRTKEQNEEIRLRRLVQIRKAAADVFLDKGMTLEIRDVAATAGLGYGTVYHYYSNKGDLLNDLLWAAMERAGAWMDALHGLGGAAGRSRGSDVPAQRRHSGVRTNSPGLRTETGSSPSTADADDPFVAAGIRLLELWAEDPGAFLLYKLAAEGFRLLPEGRAAPLADTFRREVLLPFAAVLGGSPPLRGGEATAAAADDNGSASAPHVRQAEMLLAALAGCALLPLRRGTLRSEAEDIAGFILRRLSDRARLTIEGVKTR